MFSRSVGRFAARWVQRYSQRWFSTGSTQVESIQPDEYAAAIKRLNKSNKLLRLLMFTTFSATTAAVGWQIYGTPSVHWPQFSVYCKNFSAPLRIQRVR